MKPLNTTLPVFVLQSGWVILPTVGRSVANIAALLNDADEPSTTPFPEVTI
jgi:hypothetical protein